MMGEPRKRYQVLTPYLLGAPDWVLYAKECGKLVPGSDSFAIRLPGREPQTCKYGDIVVLNEDSSIGALPAPR